MTDNSPEWSYVIEAGQASAEGRIITMAANETERAALAKRFDLPRLDHIGATLTLRSAADGIHAQGTLRGELAQRCVATGEELPVTINTDFNLRFRHATDLGEDFEEEIELDADDCDTIEYTGSQFDLGEALADTLYLALDPFPRSPNADAVLKAAGVLSEGEAGPFGALANLLKKN